MKAVFKGEVYEAIPDLNGLLFSHLEGYTPDGDIMLSFKMFTYDNNTISVVHKDVYKLAKFGANYAKILNHCNNYVTARSILLSEGKVFLVNTDGTSLLFDGDGEIMWTGSLKYKNRVPSSIDVSGDGLWGTFSDFDCIVRFNAKTMREELRLGKKGEIFEGPKGVFAEGNTLYISSFAGKKVLKAELPTYEVTELYRFNESVYSYVRGKNREFVLLESGLYEI